MHSLFTQFNHNTTDGLDGGAGNNWKLTVYYVWLYIEAYCVLLFIILLDVTIPTSKGLLYKNIQPGHHLQSDCQIPMSWASEAVYAADYSRKPLFEYLILEKVRPSLNFYFSLRDVLCHFTVAHYRLVSCVPYTETDVIPGNGSGDLFG